MPGSRSLAVLKFFRTYSKYFLVVFAALLMVTFLMQPLVDLIQPKYEDQVIGEVGGREITVGDRALATNELNLIDMLIPAGRYLALGERPDGNDDALQWILMLHDAREMGLSASETSIDLVLQSLGIDDQVLGMLRQQTRVSEAFIRQALRNWILTQTYREVVLGQAHTPIQIKLQYARFAAQNPFMGGMFITVAQGSPRLSAPLVRHYVSDQGSRVGGKYALVGHERYLDQVAPPTDAQLQELFNQYKDSLPGEGEPYGFGYRSADRVKIESLTIPLDAIEATIAIDETEALDYYDANKSRFTPMPTDASPAPLPSPYEQVRGQIIDTLRAQRAGEKAAQIIRAAQSALLDQEAVRRAPDAGGYKALPADFKPLSLHEVADRIEKQFNLRPTVSESGGWVSVKDLPNLPQIGRSALASRPEVDLASYVKSAREMNPEAGNELTPLRLQVGVPSQPMRSATGYHLFRLTAAEPARSPASLDEVREQVTQDARKLAAYRLLEQDRERLLAQAKERGLQAVADEMGLVVIDVPPTPQRMQLSLVGGLQPSPVPGLGANEAFLKAMFEKAESLPDTTPVSELPEADRVGDVKLDDRLALALFRVDDLQPMSRSDYEQASQNPAIGVELSQMLLGENQAGNALSLDSLKKRVGYTGEDSSGEEQEGVSAGASAAAR